MLPTSNPPLSSSGLMPVSVRRRIQAARQSIAAKPFFKNVSIMLLGTGLGQATSILLAPVLTRLYTPEQFGVLSVYSAILGVLAVVACLRYELAVLIAKSDKDAINIVMLSFLALFATTLAIGLGSFAFPTHWLQRLWLTALDPYRALLPIGFFCLGGYSIMLYYATRHGNFKQIAQTRISQGVVGPLSQIGLGLSGLGAVGLIVGFIIGQSTGTFSLFYRLVLRRPELRRLVDLSSMTALAARYRRFPLVSSWGALIDGAGGNQILYIMVSAYYSSEIAGFLFLAERIVARPLLMLGTSILQVYVGEAGRTATTDPAQLRRRFWQISSRQALIAVCWVALANIAGATLLTPLFGARWASAAIYLQAISIAYLAQATILPIIHTLQILERQTFAAMWQVCRLVLIVSAFLICAKGGVSAPVTIFVYASIQVLCCAVLFVQIARSIEDIQTMKAVQT